MNLKGNDIKKEMQAYSYGTGTGDRARSKKWMSVLGTFLSLTNQMEVENVLENIQHVTKVYHFPLDECIKIAENFKHMEAKAYLLKKNCAYREAIMLYIKIIEE